MFLRLTGRLSAAGSAKSAAAFLAPVNANRPRDAALTLHNNNHTFLGHRCFCISGGGVDSTRLWKRTLRDRDASAWGTADGTRSDRVTAMEPAQSAAYSDFIRRPSVLVTGRSSSSADESMGNVLFTGSWRVPDPRCASWTRLQTRASSTKRSDTGEGQAAADKEVL